MPTTRPRPIVMSNKQWKSPSNAQVISDTQIRMEDIRRKQRDHLRRVERNRQKRMINYRDGSDCAHLRCSLCVGTGVQENGTICVHFISCSCVRCSPVYY